MRNNGKLFGFSYIDIRKSADLTPNQQNQSNPIKIFFPLIKAKCRMQNNYWWLVMSAANWKCTNDNLINLLYYLLMYLSIIAPFFDNNNFWYFGTCIESKTNQRALKSRNSGLFCCHQVLHHGLNCCWILGAGTCAIKTTFYNFAIHVILFFFVYIIYKTYGWEKLIISFQRIKVVIHLEDWLFPQAE